MAWIARAIERVRIELPWRPTSTWSRGLGPCSASSSRRSGGRPWKDQHPSAEHRRLEVRQGAGLDGHPGRAPFPQALDLLPEGWRVDAHHAAAGPHAAELGRDGDHRRCNRYGKPSCIMATLPLSSTWPSRRRMRRRSAAVGMCLGVATRGGWDRSTPRPEDGDTRRRVQFWDDRAPKHGRAGPGDRRLEKASRTWPPS
jgi:hypothetical protein